MLILSVSLVIFFLLFLTAFYFFIRASDMKFRELYELHTKLNNRVNACEQGDFSKVKEINVNEFVENIVNNLEDFKSNQG